MITPAPEVERETLELIAMLRANANEPWATLGGRPFMLDAANAIEALHAKLTEVERERDEWAKAVTAQVTSAGKDFDRAEKAEADSAALRERVAELEDGVFHAFNYIAATKFEPDDGQPHPLPDFSYDRIIAKLRALSHKDETP